MDMGASNIDMTRRPSYHLTHGRDVTVGTPKDAVKLEFGRRLQMAMIQKGMNQSDLARRLEMEIRVDEQGNPIRVGRDSISTYIRGKVLPSPARLKALAKILDVTETDLLPTPGRVSSIPNAPSIETRDLGDGNVWLRINQGLPWSDALRILAILRGDD